LTDAGRTVQTQRNLISRWFEGGPANRPPNLFEPKRPPEESDHVKNGGEAVDVINWPYWRVHAREFGWVVDYDWDKVHFRYDPDHDQYKDDDMFSADDRNALKAILDRVNGALPGPENGRAEYGRVLDTGDGAHILSTLDRRVNELAGWTRDDANRITNALTNADGTPVPTDAILAAIRELPHDVIAALKDAL
jgi:hypothetical protein